MSRNKQVDRLRAGLDVFIDSGDIKDPVEAVLELLHDQRQELKTLANIIVEDKEFFDELHAEMFHQGCSEALVIHRKGSTDASLAMLGWVNQNPKFETREERAELITINGMVMAHLRDCVLAERKTGESNVWTERKLKDHANENYFKACDKLHKTLMDVGIWTDPMRGAFHDMLEAFRLAYVKMCGDKNYYEYTLKAYQENVKAVLASARSTEDALRKDFNSSKEWIRSQNEVIAQLTKELKHQTVTTKQYKRENGLLRADIIKREISGEKL